MTTDSDQAPGRTRTGLAKLRGAPVDTPNAVDTAVEAPPESPVAAPAPPASTVPPGAQQLPVTVSLLKPGHENKKGAPRRISGRIFVGALALVLAIAVLLTFVLRWGDQLTGTSDSNSNVASGVSKADVASDNDRFAALQAARQFSVSFFTYDYRKIDAYFRRVESASTGSFRSDFVSKEGTLKTVVVKLKTVATGQVADTGAGIYALADNKAIAFVAANLNASNATTKNGQRRYRIKLTLEKVKGSWLVSDFQEVL